MPWKVVSPGAVACHGIDPYLFWALNAGLEDFLLPLQPAQSFPLLVQWDQDKAQALANAEEKLASEVLELWWEFAGRDAKERFRREMAPSEIRFLSLTSGQRLFGDHEFKPIIETFKEITIGPPLPHGPAPRSAGTARRARSRRAGWGSGGSPRPVVIGVIDDGLAFGNARFRKPDGTTRVEFVWVQDEFLWGTGPYEYGREIRKSDIDGWLTASTYAGAVDEDEFYRRAGVGDFVDKFRSNVVARASHGAHVMDIACGFDPQNAPDWRIVGVQLPIRVTADSSGASLAVYALDAVKFIRDRAKQIAGPNASLPVVINFSYGIVAGPHDGTHPIEAQIDQIVSGHNNTPGNAPMRVVLPSGNSHLRRAHARVSFSQAQPVVTLPWRVLPDDGTPSFVEIWLPEGPANARRVEVIVETPDGLASAALGENDTGFLQLEENGLSLCEVRYCFFPTTQRGMFFIGLQPTTRLESKTSSVPTGPVAPSGTWTISLRNLELLPEQRVEAWIQRDDTPFGFRRRGRQSYFDHPCYTRFEDAGREIEEDAPDCVVKRYGSINAIATGGETIVIGGLLRKELRAAPYSAAGPVTTPVGSLGPPRDGPDAVAVSEDSVVHEGVLAAGTRSGSVVAINGTSVAAPRIARWIAGELSANDPARPGDRNAVTALAATEEGALPPLPAAVETVWRYGAGRILLSLPNPAPRGRRPDDP